LPLSYVGPTNFFSFDPDFTQYNPNNMLTFTDNFKGASENKNALGNYSTYNMFSSDMDSGVYIWEVTVDSSWDYGKSNSCYWIGMTIIEQTQDSNYYGSCAYPWTSYFGMWPNAGAGINKDIGCYSAGMKVRHIMNFYTNIYTVLGYDASGNFLRGAASDNQNFSGRRFRPGVLLNSYYDAVRITDSAHFYYSATTMPKLTQERILSSSFKFYNDGGYLGIMTFSPTQNRVTTYSNPNETFWSFEADGTFCLHHVSTQIYTRFYNFNLNNNGKFIIVGWFLPWGNWRHFLFEQ